ncbi:MAG: hypothetical protein ABSA83_05750 [Verrucomicrobiota bacterium]|jgi:hypothetical protein
MAAVSETIVREYFELHGFLTRQDRKYSGRGKQEKDGIDFFVWNPQTRDGQSPVPFIILTAEDLAAVKRAIVVVRGWHTESFGPALLENSPEMFRFVEPAVFEQAARSFSPDAAPLKILVVPALAQTAAAREQSIRVLRAKGIDAVIPFRAMLADLIARTEVNRNYDKSDLLQIIRVLKNYEFLKEPQMELFRLGRRGKRPVKA